MKLKDLKISKQITIYLSAVLIVIILLVTTSFISMHELWSNTTSLYHNSLSVRRAVGMLEARVLFIHRDMRQLPLVGNAQEIEHIINTIAVYEGEIERELATLYDRYTGPIRDIDEAAEALARWRTIRNETVRLLYAGQVADVIHRVSSDGLGGLQADTVLSRLHTISDFTRTRADTFFAAALQNRDRIIIQMIVLCLGVLLLLLLISISLRKGVLPPLATLTTATESIIKGNLDTRIDVISPNELGDLSHAFNVMAETIQKEMDNKEKISRISSVMFKNTNLRPFCQELLKNLLEITTSQMCAIYMLDENSSRFECYESIGTKDGALCSFSANLKEGEFGAVLASKSMQHVTEIPSDTHIVFSTVSGEYKVKEIITIPISKKDTIISVISLASVHAYTEDILQLIPALVNEISASLHAVIASEKIVEFSQKLQTINVELEQQARELEAQTEELFEQNTELEMQKQQLGEASRLKTHFLSNMSHELRTPLNSIIALSGVLSRKLAKKIPDEEYSYLEIIERNGKNLLTMINDVLDISRIEAGKEEVEISNFNINESILEVLTMVRPLAEQRHVSLLHEFEKTELMIQSDAEKVRHILQNVVGNAIKFTENGSVTIKASKNEQDVTISVLDTGIGIAEEHLPYIFNEFRQADGSTSRKYGGTGLGLAIAKKYATFLRGTIEARSMPHVGSEFIITLPCNWSEDQGIGETKKVDTSRKLNNLQNYDLSGKTILLVEDNESAIIQIKDLVEDLGCTIAIAHNAKEAFSIIEHKIPDAMILDLMMPEIDGFHVLKLLRNADITAHIPVLILTAKHITKDELQFLKRNNVYQLIQKGDVKRLELQMSVMNMLLPKDLSSAQTSKKKRSDGKKPSILVVEDNVDNMITVKALLKEAYIVLEAFTAHDGVKIATEKLPDLILMDIALPDMSGIEAFKNIRNMPTTQHIPVIALTASVMKLDRETILSHGFDAFIGKPIISHEFFKILDEVLYGTREDQNFSDR